MLVKEKDLIAYLARIKNLFEPGFPDSKQVAVFEDISLKELECAYIFDLVKNRIVYHQGFDKVFGFSKEMINLPLILSRYHPQDGAIVKRLIKNCLDVVLTQAVMQGAELLKMVYRFKDAKGNYRHILSNTFVYKTDEKGKIQQFLIKYTDLNFLENSDIVEWWVNDDWLDKERILQEIYGDRRFVFTGRELDVVKEMIRGGTNVEIARALNISEHTVSTHRKNIFNKAACNEVVALYKFCKANGILTQ